MDKYMKIALEEAMKSYKNNDVPVGAVIVKNEKVIARAHNQKEKKKNATRHAEIIVIEKACRKLKTWHLNDCTLYVTLEPCMMCCGAIIQSRIKKVIYATTNDKFGYIESVGKLVQKKKKNHYVKLEKGIGEQQSISLLKQFFKEKR